MNEKIQTIFENSNNLYNDFISQQNFVEEVAEIGKIYGNVFNAPFKELHLVATDMVNFVFASPFYEGDLFVHDKTAEGLGRVLLAIPSKEEAEKYAENSNCEMVYLDFADILYLFDAISVEAIALFFSDGVIEINKEDFTKLLFVYQAPTPDIDYIVGVPSEDYSQATEEITKALSSQESIKSMWLYHVVEMPKDDSQKIFDIIIVDTTIEDYFAVKNQIQNIVYSTNEHIIKVFLKDSDFGEFLSSNNIEPFYKK